MNTYEGVRNSRFAVTKNGQDLDIARSQAVQNHSVGFSWAYAGQGPLQLALAILLEETDAATALAQHRAYCLDVIANLSQAKGWTITTADVQAWLLKQQAKGCGGVAC